MLKIGVIAQDRWSEAISSELQKIIKDKTQVESSISTFQNAQEIWNEIRSAKVSVMASPLSLLPTTLPKGIVITALGERLNSSNSLIISTNNMDETQFLSLKAGTLVGFQNDINFLQFSNFEANCSMQQMDMTPFQAIEMLEKGDFGACVLPTECLQYLDLDENKFKIIPFSPKEYIPLAGQGVTAYLTDEEDLTTRRLLKAAFQGIKLPTGQPVSTVTNIERKVKQLCGDMDIAVYCEIDRAKNYHLLAAAAIYGELKKVRISQSTSFELAEKCYDKLYN
jgi:porphobilinogen deaminase